MKGMQKKEMDTYFFEYFKSIIRKEWWELVVKIRSEKVGNMLNQWYATIKLQQVHKATQMKKEIQKAIDNMEKNQDVLLYFNMIDSRYKLLIEKYNESGSILKSLKYRAEEKKTDDMLQYYFYFFSGLYQFYIKNFTKAINFYRIAENWINKIPDEAERAEFNYQIAIAYYEIHQNFFSLTHAEKALESFLALGNYENRAATTQMIIAANRLDLHQYELTESVYKKAIKMAADTRQNYVEGLGHHNLGLAYERQEKLDLARESFEIALDIFENLHSKIAIIRTSYMLARVLFKKGLFEEGTHWYQKALNLAKEINEKTYEAKLLVIHSIYKELDKTLLDKGLNMLRDKKLWSDVADLAIIAARHFKKKEYHELAAKYFDEGVVARDKIQTWTEELVS
ncbi:Rap family tetratricopeptide repeat protein [Bacillus licheniformis]|jgi:tetratricopeptide (TPR) repeat protein|uniref:Response regulator aspartate phosphatase I n=3 Tax=Bacillus licheniformis TaxID=1402 RepID=A0A8B5YBL6_BACLI|nr:MULTISPECIES: Rap family tetratricopeptide repeat protein [Bacillus]MBJ7886801.1 tetratricopeptide repeat protein [Bacillaceae bacterium HSR45]MBY8347479.1 tetratricopeptide repeat protein [Bacillus sp. PCH94]MDP4082529.1 tetratricopeptide repeat protein [Bacillota bacterium]AMR11480.1 aspartate phosphatase [Bacillus licheniformis]APJ27958.1 aspartate phosphatase [Bacillus sp. H15-1]